MCLFCKLERRESRGRPKRERACAGHREREGLQVQRANDLHSRRGAVIGVVQRESVEK